jgi:hypothetical protein
MTADMMEVLMGADSASGFWWRLRFLSKDGMGKLEQCWYWRTVGEQTYKGVIKFKKPDGIF